MFAKIAQNVYMTVSKNAVDAKDKIDVAGDNGFRNTAVRDLSESCLAAEEATVAETTRSPSTRIANACPTGRRYSQR
jgi:hypothetical protein